MRIKTLVALYFWILEFDDVTCIRPIETLIKTDMATPGSFSFWGDNNYGWRNPG